MLNQEYVKNKLLELGIPCNLMGFRQIILVIMEISKNENIRFSSICKNLSYDQRSLSRSIERACSKITADKDKTIYYFGNKGGAANKMHNFYMRLKEETQIMEMTRNNIETIVEDYLKERGI